MEHNVDGSDHAGDLDRVQEWARLTACQTRRNAAGMEKYRAILESQGEAQNRMQAIKAWRDSAVFTAREKAVLSLSEAMSSKLSQAPPPEVLKEAKRHFTPAEMIRLTLDIMAINDWINRHANSPSRILVAEDDPMDRELLQRQLQKAQMHENVIFAPDARRALTVLEEYRGGQRDGDLLALFLDLRLPGMSGVDLLRRVRAMPGLEHLPVIVMTSSNDPKDINECQKMKVTSYVEKPITFASFSKAVANIFHQSTPTVSLARAGHCH
jgi:two-component system, response regulator